MNDQISDDVVRDNIMRVLYDIHASSKSAQSIAKGTKQLYSAIKKEHDYKQNVISHHLDYLVQKGWVTEQVIKSEFTTPTGATVPQKKTQYKISAQGIEMYEAGSAFHYIKKDSTINVTGMNNVVIVGEGNVVNANFSELSQKLSNLETAISNSHDISEDNKLEVLADLATIQNQIAKNTPNKSILKAAWEGLKGIATVSGVISAYEQASHAISTLF